MPPPRSACVLSQMWCVNIARSTHAPCWRRPARRRRDWLIMCQSYNAFCINLRKEAKNARVQSLVPAVFACGQREVVELILYHTHQVIALPVMRPHATHWRLHQGRFLSCGTLGKASLPIEQGSGYGPRLTGFIGEMAPGWGQPECGVRPVCLGLRHPTKHGGDAEDGGSGLHSDWPP